MSLNLNANPLPVKSKHIEHYILLQGDRLTELYHFCRPMFVIMDDDPTYAANFIVSTISEILSQSSSSSISINDTSSTCNQPHRTVASNTDTSDSGGYESHHTKPALSNGRRCIGRIEKAKQIPTQRQMPNSLPHDTRYGYRLQLYNCDVSLRHRSSALHDN